MMALGLVLMALSVLGILWLLDRHRIRRVNRNRAVRLAKERHKRQEA